MTPTPKQIAAGLTKAQQRVVLQMGDDWRTAKESQTSDATMNSLMDWDCPNRGIQPPIGLVSRDYTDSPRLAWIYRLTPRGLAVRKELEKAP